MNKPKTSKKTTQVAVASVLGLALLAGGSTYALWSATDTADTAATITTGDLQVTAGSVQNWFDVSDEANPVEITDLANFRIVPGDVLELTQDLNVIVHGDNIAAELNVDVPNATADAFVLAQAKFAVSVYDQAGELVGSVAPVTNGPDSLSVNIASLVPTDAVGETYTVKVTVELPSEADNDTKLKSIALNDMVITLNQTL